MGNEVSICFSKEVSGQRILKSWNSKYLRAYDGKSKVDLAPEAKEWEQWVIEDWNGKVVFKAIHSPPRFLRAWPHGHVDLADKPQSWEMWIPWKHEDGTWSFRNNFGKWLSARENGSLTCVGNCDGWEKFWLEDW